MLPAQPPNSRRSGHEERDVQDVDLSAGCDLEPVVEHHDGVVGDGAADERVHAFPVRRKE